MHASCLVCRCLLMAAADTSPSSSSTLDELLLPCWSRGIPAAGALAGAATDAAELVRVLPKTGIEAELSGGLKGWTCTAPKKLYVGGRE